MNNSVVNFKYCFIAIEEKKDFYITKSLTQSWDDDLIIFKSNPFQVLCFLKDFLDVFENLRICNVEVSEFTFRFAVDMRNKEIWSFRLDEANRLIYYKYDHVFKIHKYVQDVVYALRRVVKDVAIQNFLKKFIELENSLMHLSDFGAYYGILVKNIENAKLQWKK